MPLISNCSMMPAWHQLVSMSGHVEESETARKLQLYATSIYQVHSFVCQLDYMGLLLQLIPQKYQWLFALRQNVVLVTSESQKNWILQIFADLLICKFPPKILQYAILSFCLFVCLFVCFVLFVLFSFVLFCFVLFLFICFVLFCFFVFCFLFLLIMKENDNYNIHKNFKCSLL